MTSKNTQSPKPNLRKKSISKNSEKARTKQQFTQKLAKEQEALLLEVIASNLVLKKAGIGVGDFETYIEEFMDGFRKVFTARGLAVPEELKRGPYGKDKENAPRVTPLFKQYGVVPPTVLDDKNSPQPKK